jgi:phage terminase small subunit
MVNSIKFKEDFEVDGEIISEIKTSRQGSSIKLESRDKAVKWLTDYFEFNPEHKYKKEFDEKKLQLEKERFEHQKEMDELNKW